MKQAISRSIRIARTQPPKKIEKIEGRAGPSAVAVRLRQMAWVTETAKMLPPHALRYNADLWTHVPKAAASVRMPKAAREATRTSLLVCALIQESGHYNRKERCQCGRPVVKTNSIGAGAE
jgi:hypothetical protein